MFLLPIGVDDSAVDRLPWVSIGIAGACAAMFIASLVSTPTASIEPAVVEQRLEDLARYVAERPHVSMPRACLPFFDDFPVAPDAGEGGEGQRVANEMCDRVLTGVTALERQPPTIAALGFVAERGVVQHGLITYLFVHGGFLHLFGNMLFFYIAGPYLEDRWGRVVFPIFYFLGGIAAAIAQYLGDPSSTVPVVGASGAVAACMGAFAFRFYRRRVRMFYLIFIFLRPKSGTFFVPAWLWGGFWFASEYLSYYLGGATANGTAVLAHLGGFGFGVVAALAMKLSGFEDKVLAPAIEKKTTWTFGEDGRASSPSSPSSSTAAPTGAARARASGGEAKAIADAITARDDVLAAQRFSDALRSALSAADEKKVRELVAVVVGQIDLGPVRPALLHQAGLVVEETQPEHALALFAEAAREGGVGAAKPLVKGAELLARLGRRDDAFAWTAQLASIPNLPKDMRDTVARLMAELAAAPLAAAQSVMPARTTTTDGSALHAAGTEAYAPTTDFGSNEPSFDTAPTAAAARRYDPISIDDDAPDDVLLPPVEKGAGVTMATRAPSSSSSGVRSPTLESRVPLEIFPARITGPASGGVEVVIEGVGAMHIVPDAIRDATAAAVTTVDGRRTDGPVIVLDLHLVPSVVGGRAIALRMRGDELGLETLFASDHESPWRDLIGFLLAGARALPAVDRDRIADCALTVVDDVKAFERIAYGREVRGRL